MTAWLVAAILLLVAIIPCAVVVLRGRTMERLVALQGVQILTVLILLLLTPGYGRDIYIDVSLTLAVLNLAAGLVFIRFLERWL